MNLNFLFLIPIFFALLANSQDCTTETAVWLGGEFECSEEPFKLVFSDEFEGPVIDESKWYTFYPFGENFSDQCEFCRTHGDEEGQIYLDENLEFENGILKLIVKEQNSSWYSASREFTSGMIYSKQQFEHGKFEIKCKIPSGKGLWPAFWLWKVDECDVFEICGHDPTQLNTNLHMTCDDQGHQVPESHSVIDLSQDFHVYSVEWDPFYVQWSLDGQVLRKFHKFFTLTGNIIECGDDVANGSIVVKNIVPDVSMSVIANLALSKGPTGYCDPDFIDETTPYPSSMDIDYIRVYQKEPNRGLVDLCDQNSIEGSNFLCSETSYAYSLEGTTENILWETSDNLTVISINDGEIVIEPSSTLSGVSGWIRASFDNHAACPNSIVEKRVWIGKPKINDVILPECFQIGSNVSLFADIEGAESVYWSFPQCNEIIIENDPNPNCWYNYTGDYNQIFVYVGEQKGSISLWVENECGITSMNIPINFCDRKGGSNSGGPIYPIVIYPNPAEDLINIDLVPEENEDISKIYLVKNSNNTANEIYISSNTNNTVSADVSNYESGLYHIIILTKNSSIMQSQPFIIQR